MQYSYHCNELHGAVHPAILDALHQTLGGYWRFSSYDVQKKESALLSHSCAIFSLRGDDPLTALTLIKLLRPSSSYTRHSFGDKTAFRVCTAKMT